MQWKGTLYFCLLVGPDMFEIDSNSGVISVSKPLDREDPAVSDLYGVIELTIQVGGNNLYIPASYVHSY